jgi:hypothetical protein
MHAGSRIVQLSRSGDEWEFAVLAKFEEHKSMNYGSDVQPLVAGAGDVCLEVLKRRWTRREFEGSWEGNERRGGVSGATVVLMKGIAV